MKIRTGIGFDVHRLEAGLPLWLGGVLVPHEKGCIAHSDGDVLIHAICDALLGAAGMGDIGYHFPDTALEFKGIDSKLLLKRTVELIRKQGYEIGADDYIIKPFDSELLILKIKAILSRCEHDSGEDRLKVIQIGRYDFNTELRTVTWDGDQVIKLTPKEAHLLELLYKHQDGLLTREKALNEIWGANDYFTARSMDVYITKLRKFFKDDESVRIENIHGSGFRLVIDK